MVANDPQELCFCGQVFQVLIRDLFSVEKYIEGGVEQGESEVKRDDL